MKKKKTIINIAMAVFLFFGLMATPVAVFADEYGLDVTAGAAGLNRYNSTPPVLVGSVIGAALSLVGIIFFILVVYGGVLWMTARGNEEQTKKALNTIIAASIGIIIVLSSYAITNFVLSSLEEGIDAPPTGGPPPE